MILSDEDAFERLNSSDNIVNLVQNPDNINPRMNGSVVIVPANKNGQGDRGPAVPDMIRRLIANTANASDETKTEVANIFGVGVPDVSNYSRGLVHTRLDTDLQEIATKSKEQKTETAHNLALDSLVATLGLVGPKLVEATSLKEVTDTAVRLSRVVKDLRPKEDDGPKAKTLVVITMPNVKKETAFDCIDV